MFMPTCPDASIFLLLATFELLSDLLRAFGIMDMEQARQNMIEQQIRPWDVLDARILEVLATTPREAFVPRRYQKLAFADLEVPLDHGQVMMAPKVEARMLQALEVKAQDRALEIGTGSGYVAACLAKLASTVDTVDLLEDFVASAQSKYQALELKNITVHTDDAVNGWQPAQPFDAIAVTASFPEYRNIFERQLTLGGRLFVVVGEPPIMSAMLITRLSAVQFLRVKLFETCLAPMIHAPPKPKFVF